MPAVTNLLIALSLLGPHGAHRPPVVQNSHFVSPSLSVLSGKRVDIMLPPGWKVVQQDPLSQWATPVYSFVAGHGTGKSAETRRIDILTYTITGEEFKGTFKGIKFTTLSGLLGLGSVQAGEGGARDWYLTIPPSQRMPAGYIAVRLHFQNIDVKQQRTFATFVYARLRYVK